MNNDTESKSLKNSLQINSNLADKITLLFNNLNQITNNIVNIEDSTEDYQNPNKNENDFYQKQKSDEIFIKPVLLSRENTGDFKHTLESFENEKKDFYNEKEKLDFLLKKNENFNLDIETSLKNISNSFSFNKDNKEKINYDYSEISDQKQSNFLNLSKNTNLKEDLLNSDLSKQNIIKKQDLIIDKKNSFHELVNTNEFENSENTNEFQNSENTNEFQMLDNFKNLENFEKQTKTEKNKNSEIRESLDSEKQTKTEKSKKDLNLTNLENTEELEEDRSMSKFYKNLKNVSEKEDDKSLNFTERTNKSFKKSGKMKKIVKSYKSVHDLIDNLKIYKERGIREMTCFDLEQYHKNMEVKIRKNLVNYRFKN